MLVNVYFLVLLGFLTCDVFVLCKFRIVKYYLEDLWGGINVVCRRTFSVNYTSIPLFFCKYQTAIFIHL